MSLNYASDHVDPYTIRKVAESVIGEDRVPTDELVELVACFGSDEQRRAVGIEVEEVAA